MYTHFGFIELFLRELILKKVFLLFFVLIFQVSINEISSDGGSKETRDNHSLVITRHVDAIAKMNCKSLKKRKKFSILSNQSNERMMFWGLEG